jgi:predicted RNA binding protein YcfA (HicA-like mRNA interferase family)
MPMKAREVIGGLEKKGFERRDGKDIFLHLKVNGLKTAVFTKVSQAEKEIHDGLLAAMARQLRLSRRQFDDLVRCPLDAPEYLQLLRDGNHID